MSGSQTFACPKCGKRFTWKPQYAGRKVSCTCGRLFEATLGLEGLEAHGDAYDLEAEHAVTAAPFTPPGRNASTTNGSPAPSAQPRSARPRSARPRSARPCSARPRSARPMMPDPSITALYPQRKRVVPRTAGDDDANLDPEAANPLVHVFVPWALLVIGIGGRLGQTVSMTEGASIAAAMIRVIIEVHLSAAIMLGGAYIAAMVMGVNFGSLSRATVKLAGISVFSGAVAALAASIDRSPDGVRGMVLGMHVALLLYFALFYALFDLDLQESLTTVIIVWVLQWFLAAAMLAAVARH